MSELIVDKALWDRADALQIEHERKRDQAIEALRELYKTKAFWKPDGPLGSRYKNWPDFCKQKFDYNKTQAYGMLRYDGLRQDCKAQGIPAPTHESQTRPISLVVNNAKRRNQEVNATDLWLDVLNMTKLPPKEITAKAVENVMQETGRMGARKKSDIPAELQELRNRLTALLNCNAIAKYSGAELCRKHKLDPKLRAKVAEAWDRLGEILECG